MTFLRTPAAISALLFSVFLGLATGAAALPLDNELRPGATAGCAPNVSAPQPRSRAASNANKVLPPQSGYYAGAYQIPAQAREVERFANAVGHYPPILFTFHDLFADTYSGSTPNNPIDGKMEGSGSPRVFEMANYLHERGSVLALAWAIYCCDIERTGFWLRLKKPHDHVNRILRGEHDDYFRQSARLIKQYGKPLMITLVPEMNWQGQFMFGADGRRWMDAVDNICNQYGDPSWPDGPERVRDLNMRVIDIFRSEGVTNVTWFMYSGNNYMANREGESVWLHPKYYYPGDAYIDWTGQSLYFSDAARSGQFEDIGTFDQVFVPGYNAWRSVTNRPMLLAEFGIISDPSQSRSALWTDVLERQLQRTPGVKAIAIADSILFEQYFDIPMLSRKLDEVTVFRQSSQSQGIAQRRLRTRR